MKWLLCRLYLCLCLTVVLTLAAMKARSQNVIIILCNLTEYLGSFFSYDGISSEQRSDK